MATTLPIQLNVPADLYARIQEAAARSERPVEMVLVESLALLFNAPSVDWDHLAATLDALSDAQLWALVHRRAAWMAAGRLHDLTAQGKQEDLSDAEQDDLAALVDEVDRMTLLRSQALRILQQRGHNIHDYLQLGPRWPTSRRRSGRRWSSGHMDAVNTARPGRPLRLILGPSSNQRCGMVR